MIEHESATAATGRCVAAVDVGGTSLKGALVDGELRIVEEVRGTFLPRDRAGSLGAAMLALDLVGAAPSTTIGAR